MSALRTEVALFVKWATALWAFINQCGSTIAAKFSVRLILEFLALGTQRILGEFRGHVFSESSLT